MKRFYCTVCKKVKRVRRFPVSIEILISVSPIDRTGECNWHVEGRIKPLRGHSIRVRPNEVKITPIRQKKGGR